MAYIPNAGRKSTSTSPLSTSSVLLSNEPKRSVTRKSLDRINSKEINQSFPDQELLSSEGFESTFLSTTNCPTDPSRQESKGFFSMGDRTVYQAGHATLRKIQGAAEVAGNRISDWIKPLIPNKAATDSEERIIYMLGIAYPYTPSKLAEVNEKYPPEFMDDFRSRLWFTYRTGFLPIPPSNYVSDIGWGCMLRSAQMLLGQALIMLKLGREWRRDSTAFNAQEKYAEIISLFMDEPSSEAPFSLHRFCAQGRQLGKNVGEWFGPATASQAMKCLINSYDSLDMGVYIATDGVVYRDQISMVTQGNQRPLMILLPTRLGINTLNSIYFPAIKGLLALHQSLGIAGGKPSASLYFLAYEGDLLYYLDPHYPRSATRKPSTGKLAKEELSSYHCDIVRTIAIQKIDPCMMFGFFCNDEDDINAFLKQLEELSKMCEAPILAVARETPIYLSDEDLDTFEEGFMLNSD